MQAPGRWSVHAFSFVMAALQRLEPKDGMTAMQAINTTAVEPGLMAPFGPRWPTRGGYHGNQQLGKRRLSRLLVGSLSYVLGTLL